jgi:hypothetical protein
MKKLQILIIMLALLGLQACRTRALRAPVKALHTVQSITVPQPGATVTAGIGEALLTQGDASSTKFLLISSDQIIGNVTVRNGKYILIEHTGEYDGFRVLLAKDEPAKKDRFGMLLLFDKDKGSKNACLSKEVCGTIEFSTEEKTNVEEASFQQTLLYSGKIGNRITLGYREFSNTTARPAFNNDVAYDLSESTVLGYKGARIEVIKATNTDITYKVISGFQ